MPNHYELKLTRGAAKLQRRHDRGPDDRFRPPMGGGGTRAGLPGLSTKDRVSTKWSRRSQQHMRFEFGALPWEVLGRRPVMITLTYPGEWEVFCPDSRTLVRHREALRSRWTRRFGTPVGVWVTEFQKRGAPHLHMYLGLPDSVSEQDYEALRKRTIKRKHLEREVGSYAARRQLRAPSGEFASWLRDAWWQIVGSGLSAHHGRGVDIATAFFSDEAEAGANRAKVAEYFWRESGRWAQKQVPEDFGSLKFYGRWGGKEHGFNPVITEAELDDRAGLELRRVMRRWQEQKRRETAKRLGYRYRKGAARSRGRDGLTVFDVDGRTLGPILLRWAEDLAVRKAAGEDPTTQRFVRLAGRPSLRAWSEFEVEWEGICETREEEPPEPWDEWAAVEAHLDALDRAEAELWEQAAVHEQRIWERGARQARKVELRREERARWFEPKSPE